MVNIVSFHRGLVLNLPNAPSFWGEIYWKTKEEHPQFKIPYNKCKQLITNYLDAEKTPEPITIDQIDLNNEIFKEDDGTELRTIFNKTKGLVIMSVDQA